MKLGAKILLTTASTFLCLIVFLFFISQTVLLGSFKEHESEEVTLDIERVMSAMDQEIKNLSSLNLDWSSWDDSYNFVKDRNREYIKSNLNIETLAKQRLNLLAILDTVGRPVFLQSLDHAAIKPVPAPESLLAAMSPDAPIATNTRESSREGILQLNQGFLMISSRPILTSEGRGPVRGTLIMGRMLDGKETGRLSETTHIKISILPYETGMSILPPGAQSPFASREGIFIRPISNKKIAGYGIVKDIYGRPALIVYAEFPRDILAQGQASVFYFIVYLVLAALVSAAALLFLLRKSVLSRLSYLSVKLGDIGRTGNLSERVKDAGKDELADLSGEINMMLASLESLEEERKASAEKLREARDELEVRVKERTAELLEKNIALNQEVAERKKAEEAMREMIYHDYLTGLPNRLLFSDRLNQVITRGHWHKDTIAAILLMDLDRFKVVNDSLGHSAGDEVIKAVASKAEGSLREGDTVARIGGDEFTMLLQDLARPEDLPAVIGKIMNTFKAPVRLRGHDVFLTASIGVAIYPYDGSDPTTLIKNAEIAMYHAKNKGGNTYEMYNPEMAKKVIVHLTVGNKLRTALAREEFILHYQPQYDIRTGRITGSEALIRWQDPDQGLIPPMNFIPIAEETGLITPIGEWGLREACLMHRRMEKNGLNGMDISVNISPRMFREPDFTKNVRKILVETGLDPKCLNLEITEGIIMDNLEEAAGIIKELKGAGVKFSIDDFGTGYSSLGYLKNLSIDELKIDRSFIKDLPGDAGDRLIVKAIINLAHSLNLDVIAEGAETRDQLDFLIEHQCDKVQGFVYSKPVPEEEFAKLLKTQPEAGNNA